MRYKGLAAKLVIVAILALVGYFNIGGCGGDGDDGEPVICEIQVFDVTEVGCDDLEIEFACIGSDCIGTDEVLCQPCDLFGCLVCPDGPD